MPDNYFDKELQDQLRGYRAEYNPADWEAMEQMLDHKKWYNLPWVRTVAVAALITGVALTAWLVTDNPQAASTPSMAEEQADSPEAIYPTDEVPPLDQTQIPPDGGSEQKPEQTITTHEAQVDAAQENARTTTEREDVLALSQQTESNTGIQKSTSESVSDPSPGQKPNKVGLQVGRLDSRQKEKQQDPLINYPTRSSWAGMPEGYVTRSIRLMEPLEPLTIDQLGPYHRPGGGGTDALQEYKQRMFRFWIGATGIPSLNVMTKAKLGYHAGVRVGVDFGQGTSLETGLGYTRFTYDEPVTAERQDYYLSTDPYFHQSTQGDLRYLEIPLRVNYNLGDFARIQPYVAVGVSGFLTLTEDYVFNYKRNPNAISSNITPAADNTTDTVHLQNFGGTTSASTMQEDASNAYQTLSYKPATTGEMVELQPFYLMGQLATGVNYMVTAETALNLGINYRFPVSGFGVENRSLHTVGVELGLRHIL